MKHKKLDKITPKQIFGLTSLAIIAFIGCSESKEQVNQTEDKEPIREESFANVEESSILDQDFSETILKSNDGYKLLVTEHLSFADTEYYQLFSPDGNLCLVASGCQECCSLAGYTVEYNSEGKEVAVNFIGTLDDEEYQKLNVDEKDSMVDVFKKWLKSSCQKQPIEEFKILRDKDNEVTSIGTIEVPWGYKAKYHLDQWGPFWTSDLSGGVISFFVTLECQQTEGSYVNYLYSNNKIIAELAYWKGTFIKARTYNRMGVMVKEYSDRDMNVLDQCFYDWSETPKWYVEK